MGGPRRGAVSRSVKSVVALSRSASPNRVVKMTVNASAGAKADDGRRGVIRQN